MNIEEVRTLLKMNRPTFNKMYKVPIRTLEDWESGKRNPPDYVLYLLERCIKEDLRKGEIKMDNEVKYAEMWANCYINLFRACNILGIKSKFRMQSNMEKIVQEPFTMYGVIHKAIYAYNYHSRFSEVQNLVALATQAIESIDLDELNKNRELGGDFHLMLERLNFADGEDVL